MTTRQSEFDTRLTELVGLIDELVALIDGENAYLESGLPSAVSRSTGRKAELGAELDLWVRQVRSGEVDLAIASPMVRRRLTERAEVLDEAIRENMVRLQAGIDATRLRVDAIMRAIREQTVREGGYDATGRRARLVATPSSLLA
ncbi:MAG: flagellar protein FlgN [Hyphomicrobiales bacterium]|nr:MAG: flagellar protein FlgN [Hyphomicrobiales bacterium]